MRPMGEVELAGRSLAELRYADVIVDISAHALDRTFQYLVPEDMEDVLEAGAVVRVPFGSRTVTGYVVGFSDSPAIDGSRIRPLQAALTGATTEESRLTGLAFWIRDRYGCTALQALRTVLPKKAKMEVRRRKTVFLAVGGAEAAEAAAVMKRKNQSARLRLMEALISEQSLPWEIVTQKLNVSPSVVRALAARGYVRVAEEDSYRNPSVPEDHVHGDVRLNESQRLIVDSICRDWDAQIAETGGRYLIRGVTGSGKTEVYIELIAHVVACGRQAIVLIPEIALTYQTLMRFRHRFGDRVSVIHSRMSAGERSDQFERARRGDIDVMIGPRSALFTPFEHLGIIVIDEEHEESYNSSQTPRYRTRETAFQRGRMEKAFVVLGSATPSLEASWAARNGLIREFLLNRRARAQSLPSVRIVDLRRRENQSAGLLSVPLQKAVRETLDRREQVMLFLNRRGYAGIVTCRSCGKIMKCPHCDVSLTLHGDGRLLCHYCGYETEMPKTCPDCGSTSIRSWKAGTEQAEEEVRKLFPDASVLRMDRDTTQKKDAQLSILSRFADHEADILIGTQMIVKGHDFPDVTLVGILAADLSLAVPDFRASERTFQLLTQAAGRAGRGDKPGQVLVQTYQPDHYAIRCAAAQDYESFYEREIEYRKLSGYPPSGGILTVHCACPDQERLKLAAGYLRKFLERILAGVLRQGGAAILGPTEESIAKIADVYRMALYVKSTELAMLIESKNRLEKYIAANEGFRALDIQFDMDA